MDLHQKLSTCSAFLDDKKEHDEISQIKAARYEEQLANILSLLHEVEREQKSSKSN